MPKMRLEMQTYRRCSVCDQRLSKRYPSNAFFRKHNVPLRIRMRVPVYCEECSPVRDAAFLKKIGVKPRSFGRRLNLLEYTVPGLVVALEVFDDPLFSWVVGRRLVELAVAHD